MNAKTSKLINRVAKQVGQNGKALKKLWKQTRPDQRVLFRTDMVKFLNDRGLDFQGKGDKQVLAANRLEFLAKQDAQRGPSADGTDVTMELTPNTFIEPGTQLGGKPGSGIE